MMEMMSGMKTEIKSEINVVKVEMNNEFAKIRSELKMSDVNMNSRLESMNETIAGVKSEMTINAVSYTHLLRQSYHSITILSFYTMENEFNRVLIIDQASQLDQCNQ